MAKPTVSSLKVTVRYVCLVKTSVTETGTETCGLAIAEQLYSLFSTRPIVSMASHDKAFLVLTDVVDEAEVHVPRQKISRMPSIVSA